MTFQGDEESGTREEAPLTPAPRQKVSEILGNNLDVFKVVFFSDMAKFESSGDDHTSIIHVFFFLVGKWQPIELQSGPQKRSSSGNQWAGGHLFFFSAPNLGFIITQCNKRLLRDLLKTPRR